jgi:hypothetical protein
MRSIVAVIRSHVGGSDEARHCVQAGVWPAGAGFPLVIMNF